MGKPTLAFATTQYNNTPDAVPGWVRLIVAASEDEDFETHMMPVLRAVRSAV